MRFIIWPVLILLLLAFQTTWFSLFHSEIAPDFILLFVLLFSLDEGAQRGALCGFCFGLLQDIMTFSMFGFHAFTRGLVGYIVGANKERVFKDSVIFYFALVAVASIFVKALYAVVIMLMNWSLLDFSLFTINMGKYVLWNLVCAIPVWLVYTIAKEWLWRREKYYY